MYRLFYLWRNHKLFLYYILTIYIPSTFLHIMFMYMYMYNMNQFEINHSFIHSFILMEISQFEDLGDTSVIWLRTQLF